MKLYGVEGEGNFVPEIVASVPSYTAADEGRLIYVTADKKYYYATDAAWIAVGSGAGAGILESQVFG